jgi:hypothetical protein
MTSLLEEAESLGQGRLTEYFLASKLAARQRDA